MTHQLTKAVGLRLKAIYTPPVRFPRLMALGLCCGLFLTAAKADSPPVPVGGLPSLDLMGDYLPEPLFLNEDRVLRDYSPNTGASSLMPKPQTLPNPWWIPSPATPGFAPDKAPPFQVFYNGRVFESKTQPLIKDGIFYLAATDIASMLSLIVQPHAGGVQFFVDGYYLRFKPERKEFSYQSILDPNQEGSVFIEHRSINRNGKIMLPLKNVAPYLGLTLSYDRSRKHLNIGLDQVISRFSPGGKFYGYSPY